MDLFVVDTGGDKDLLQKSANAYLRKTVLNEDATAEDTGNEVDGSDRNAAKSETELPPERKELLTFLRGAISSYSENKPKKRKDKIADWDTIFSSPDEENFLQTNLDELKKNTLKAIEKKESIDNPTARQLTKMKRAERAKTTGRNWFDMAAPEKTEELENDLKVLQMRSVLDPKHFYKRNTLKTLPKYFQVGTVVHSPIDYFAERDERRNKKRSLVEELLADAQFQKYNKRKYKEVMEKRRKTGYHKANQKMKKLKKKKK